MNLLYACVIEQNDGWGAEVFFDAAFRTDGYKTINVDYRVHRHELAKCFKQVRDFDLFLLQRGDYFPLQIVKAVRRPKIFYFSELFSRRRDADHLFSSNLFDHYYVRTPECINQIVNKGWVAPDKISILLSAYDPNLYRPLREVHKDIDVLFVGSMTARRETILNQLSKMFNVVVCQAFAEDAVRLFNRAKIILNLHGTDFLDTETRVFEILGTGGFLITELLSSESPFESGTHLVEVQGYDALVESIMFYLGNEEAREAIATTGWEAVIQNHTYQQRAREIETKAEEIISAGLTLGPALNYSILKRYGYIEAIRRVRLHIAVVMNKTNSNQGDSR